MVSRIGAIMVVACCGGIAFGQRAMPADNKKPASGDEVAPTSRPAAMPSVIQKLPDYTADLAHRKYLTGDWGGARTRLAEKGLLFDLDVTQILQGNAHGGKDTNNAFRYSGSADYYFKLDTARMGLWPGGLFTLHGETKIADNINPKVGSLMPPNFQGTLPVPGDPGTTTLSEFYLTQALSEQFVIMAGKIDGTSLLDQNAFASNQRTQFMNTGLRINPTLFYSVPYTTIGALAVWLPTKWLQISTAVADNDPDGAATMTGFNTAFHGRDWYTIGQEFDFTVKPFGKTGHQRLGWFWTSRDFPELAGDGRIQFPTVIGPRLIPRQLLPRWARVLRLGNQVYSLADLETSADTWGLFYNFDQYLFTEADDPEQGVGIFGRFGYGGNPNIFEEFYSLGVSGKGSIPTRDRDTWGVGYYLANINDDIDTAFSLNAEQGVEVYYNIEITPWCHLTPDVQFIVDPVSSHTLVANGSFSGWWNNLNKLENPALMAIYGNDKHPTQQQTWGAGLAYTDSPTITYTPVQGGTFANRMMTAIPETTIFQLCESGWGMDQLLECCVQRINGIYHFDSDRDGLFRRGSSCSSTSAPLAKPAVASGTGPDGRG